MHPVHSLLCRYVGCLQCTFPTVLFLLRCRAALTGSWSHTSGQVQSHHPSWQDELCLGGRESELTWFSSLAVLSAKHFYHPQ